MISLPVVPELVIITRALEGFPLVVLLAADFEDHRLARILMVVEMPIGHLGRVRGPMADWRKWIRRGLRRTLEGQSLVNTVSGTRRPVH